MNYLLRIYKLWIVKLWSLSILAVLVSLLISIPTAALSLPEVGAASAAVIDVGTGQVLYDKHMHLKRQPASLTKVLTAIVAIEEGNLKDQVTVSRRAVYQEGSSIWLAEGEKLSLEELLYGVLLASGNDASVAVAEHIAGSIEEFADLMNRRAREMGALNSSFTNPSGLPAADHYSTAYDLAVIMRYAITNEVFARITATKNKTISWADNDWGRGLRNHNKLLWSYPDITGGKTGYTRAAGRCLLATARRNGREVAAVVLNCPDDWLEIRRLLDFGLESFVRVSVVKKGEVVHQLEWEGSREGTLGFLAGKSLDLLVPAGEKVEIKREITLKSELDLPINKGDIVGELVLYKGAEQVGRTELLAFNGLNYNSLFLRFISWLSSLFKRE